MRLLVSVRSAAEVAAAVAGGADIVDAKEPARGSLGPVDAPTLRVIAKALPPGVPLSIALGDLEAPSAVGPVLARLEGIAGGERELYVKVGLAGVREASSAWSVLAAAVAAARTAPLQPAVVAVACADHQPARGLPPDVIAGLAAEAGARGVLLDTSRKDAGDVFTWMRLGQVERWLVQSRGRGLLTALAGSLSADGVRRAAVLSADIVGVRGAACAGGRSGSVEEARVRVLAAALAQADRPSAVAV